jgi:hypothetical protein
MEVNLACSKCGRTLGWGGQAADWFRCVFPAGKPHPTCDCSFNHVFLLCGKCLRDEHTAKRTRYDGETLFIKDGDGLDGYEVRGPYGRE